MTFTEQLKKYATSALEQLDGVKEAIASKIDEAKEKIKALMPAIESGNLQSVEYQLVDINRELRTFLSGWHTTLGIDVRADSIIYGLVKSIQRHKILGGSE